MNPDKSQLPQKLIDFNQELKTLCDKYQYELRAALNSDPLRGIWPFIEVTDASPKDKPAGVPLTPPPPERETTPSPEAAPVPDEAKKNEDLPTLPEQDATVSTEPVA